MEVLLHPITVGRNLCCDSEPVVDGYDPRSGPSRTFCGAALVPVVDSPFEDDLAAIDRHADSLRFEFRVASESIFYFSLYVAGLYVWLDRDVVDDAG